MLKSIETTGKTIELAVQAAIDKLGLDRDSISVEVLENAKSGFLGIGSQPARIRATYEAPDEEEDLTPKPALSSASRNKKPSSFALKRAAREAEEAARAEAAEKAAKEAAEKAAKEAEASKPEPRRESQPRQKSNQNRERSAQKPQQPQKPAEPKTVAPAEPGSVEEKINTFLNGLMEHMGAQAVASTVKVDETTYQTELIGESLGMLIGRRGDTLDAIQHLTNYSINHSGKGGIRVNVDAENYRQKREESLQRLAVKVAGKVVRYRRNITLEPMNAYERHVIHAALQDYADVTTYSTGTEPNRRIVVAYSRYKSTGDKGE